MKRSARFLSEWTLSPHAEEVWWQCTGITYEKKSDASKQTDSHQHTYTDTSTNGIQRTATSNSILQAK